ncbi:signal recognition particle protein [Cyanobium sp. ATX 6A2]|uniref:signal recognition particle protein n=1 Tax=Cyanobium sp. ATX 6A2 TaxID=2823700 RepID=UPI0020CB7328|nr:signal recognition particle protein [Cyanobium sp. ATX 6A2]MCP9888890.1 signal recognition particle protein [Cyanobium sp. ATX 6A2]
MFDELSQRFEDAVKGLRGQATISETNVEGALKDVRRALLEADVSLQVVKEFVAEVRKKALGAEVVRGVSPDQKFIQVVHEQLVDTMGGENTPLAAGGRPGEPAVVLMAGLQGAGKTTATAKLGLHLKEQGRRALMVGADVYRPAAIEQLQTLGAQIGVEVFSLGTDVKPEAIAAAGIAKAREEGFDTVLVDTAGRLQIDQSMMEEMVRIREACQPDEVLLVVDSMIGQEAAELTRAFHEQVGITGAVLTKLDGDSRGGAALSIRKVSGAPIKFIGTGEKVEALQPFHPERMASRILGMGDVLTLVEKATKEVELADVARMQEKLQQATFDFSDFLQQMRLIKRMGSLGGLMKLIPGMNKIDDGMLKQGEQQLKRIESMIGSMTESERRNPDLLASTPSRRRRIAGGSGHPPADVDKVLADFQKMRGFMKQMSQSGGMPGMPGMGGGFPGMAGMPGMGGMPAGGAPGHGRGRAPGKAPRPAKKRKGFGDL